jgi:hypothetical protein
MLNNVETVGDAKISTAVSKFGGSSIAMTSSLDYCKTSATGVLHNINGVDFTIECWVYFTSLAADRAIVSKYGPALENLGGQGYILQWITSNQLRLVLGLQAGTNNDVLYTWPWTPSTSTWYHVALTRSGTSGRAFINGTQIGSTTTLSILDVASPNALQVGKTHTTEQYLLGYIDDLRITRGYARYTSNFTAPTTALPKL